MYRGLVTIPHQFYTCYSMDSELICTTEERRDFIMDKDSVLYQLMDLRTNNVMNGIVIEDMDYLEIQKKSNRCFSCHSGCP